MAQRWEAVQGHLGISIDGIPGPGTAAAVMQALGIPEESAPVRWPRDATPELIDFYGLPGTGQTMARAAYPLKLSWDNSQVIERFSCHVRCKDAFESVFRETLAEYGEEAVRVLRLDQFGGCLNVRKKRGGTSWSVHAFGAAIDLDPDRNQLRWGKDRAAFARPDYGPFWKIVESHGLVSLGRSRDYDWMHIQAAR